MTLADPRPPMTNEEWCEEKLREIIESGISLESDYAKTIIRLRDEIAKSQELERLLDWAEKEICNVRGLYKKFHTKPIDYWTPKKNVSDQPVS